MLSLRDQQRLAGVNPRLVRVIAAVAAAAPGRFFVTEGLRTKERQAALVKAGKSRTMRSKHLTGNAVDIVVLKNGVVTWDFAEYRELADLIKAEAERQGVKLTWGGDWKSFKDGPHFQIDK